MANDKDLIDAYRRKTALLDAGRRLGRIEGASVAVGTVAVGGMLYGLYRAFTRPAVAPRADPTMRGVPGSYVFLNPSWLPPGVPFNPSDPRQVATFNGTTFAAIDRQPDLFWDGPISRVGWYYAPTQPSHGAVYTGLPPNSHPPVDKAPVITPASGPNRSRLFGPPADVTDWSRGIGDAKGARGTDPYTDAGDTSPHKAGA